MAQQTANGNWSVEGVEDVLAAMIAGDPLSGATLRLYQSSFSPSPNSVAADFIGAEASFTGYPAGGVALTYSSVGLDAGGNPTALTNRVFFQATDAVTPNTIGGCWIDRHLTGPPATDTAVEYFSFPAPVPLTRALAFVGIVLGLQAPSTPGFAIVDN